MPNPSLPESDDRRGFLAKAAALLLGAGALVVPALSGFVAFLNPLRQKGQAGGFVRVASLAVLPEDGTPRKFPVVADRSDAWNYFPNEPIGAVFLRLTDKDRQRVEAFQVVCPHAGCFVNFDPGQKEFCCPCHTARFDLTGQRLGKDCCSPRNLDKLEVDQDTLLKTGEIWVKFQNFRTGTSEPIVET